MPAPFERVDQKVHGLAPTEESDMADRIGREVAARAVATDAIAGDERFRNTVNLPSAGSRHDEVVRAAKKLVNAGIEEPRRYSTGRVVVGDERGVRIRR